MNQTQLGFTKPNMFFVPKLLKMLFFVEPKRFVWLKCEIKIGLERKRRKGETKSKATKGSFGMCV